MATNPSNSNQQSISDNPTVKVASRKRVLAAGWDYLARSGHRLRLGDNRNGVRMTNIPLSKNIPKKLVDKNMSDETILEMARHNEFSFLGSILKCIDEAAPPVSTRLCIKTCCLAVPPALMPPSMDAKEMVMAALHFLSANQLLQPTIELGDLEKRSYEKVGAWKFRELDFDLLEECFWTNTTNYQYMGREKLCPRLEQEDLLLLKGNPPLSATGKKKVPTVPRKKKTNVTTTENEDNTTTKEDFVSDVVTTQEEEE